MSKKLNVGILYGGRSVEHQISVRSAKNVAQYIDKSEFDITIFGIDKQGKWYAMPDVLPDFAKGSALSLQLDAQAPAFIDEHGNSYTVDVVFPVLHGTDGEDGSIQGLLKAMGIPFAGSGVLGSSMAMDKLISKELLSKAGIPVSNYVSYRKEERQNIKFDTVVEKIGLPFMVKPANLGSSVGVTKVKSEADFEKALNETFKFDSVALFEEYIKGRELECAILGNANAQGSHPGEIVISPNYEFYTYEAKYEDENAVDLQIPARVDDSTAERIKKLSVESYKALKCEDFARVDLFLTESGDIYINEINTIPGFTNVSMFPSLWGQHGITYPELISKIIHLALERNTSNKSIDRSYSTAT